ncbi:MAG: hypothetical protein CVT89_03285 [Candidatus Altiarchaeales archaeon HGW-Altiarchaeales-2]|nr:MAG: hypothetical protein CVT89_03285 [Candidatus Altiarchaeales archaeon HGW-Altiarchaeales-2]
MAELVVAIPEELEQDMKEFSEVNWNLVVRRLLKSEIEKMLELKEKLSGSKFTECDVKELSDKINKDLSRRFIESIQSG